MLEPSKNRARDEKRTGLEKKLIIGVAIVSFIALAFLILYFTKKSCSVSEEVCTEKNCVKGAAELFDYIDLKVDPCQDFYHYVCGHYIKEAVKKGAPTPILQINDEFKNELKSIVVDPVKKKDTASNIAMKQFYQACMNETKIDADKDETFLQSINELGGWPLVNGSDWPSADFNWVDWHIKAAQLGLPVIGLFTFRPAKASNNQTILRVTATSLDEEDLTKGNYETLMTDIARKFEAPQGFGSENNEVYDFIKRAKKLESSIDEDDEDEEISTIKDLYHVCPQVPWLKYINGLSGDIREFNNDTEILFGSIKRYCHSLDELIKDTSSRIIADYYVWSIIHKTHDFMSRKIRNAYEELKEESSEGRFETCYALTNERFKFLKEAVYIRKKVKPQVKAQLEELIEIMKEVFIEHIKQSTWMDEETKIRGIEKTQLIEKLVGGDDVIYDVEKFDKILGVDGLVFSSDNPYQILKERNIKQNQDLWATVYGETPENWEPFFEKANQVNAFFAAPLNVMIIPAPILNSVFYNYKMPAFMNYGGIGRVIGHEIMHGFGEDGREVILENDEKVDWWTNATAEAFNSTKQCVIKEYESYSFKYKLNGTITLEENLSDFVGIDVAYEAYARWVKKHGAEKRLPGIPLSPQQIFWIQTGTFLCFRKLDDSAADLEGPDEHAVPGFRVSAGAKHSRYFYKDFNCPEGSPMNPKEKCRVL